MNRLADLVLMYETDIEESMELARQDMPKQNGSSANLISDPTAKAAIRKMTPLKGVYVELGNRAAGKRSCYYLRYPHKWLSAIRRTWDFYKIRPAYQKIMELRYKKRIVDINAIAAELDVSSQRIYVMLNIIHRFLMDYAEGLGASAIEQPRAERVIDVLKSLKKEGN